MDYLYHPAALFLLLSCLILASDWASGQDLRNNLRHFEILRHSDLSHNIVKRGADPTSSHRFNKIREVGFKALGRDFRLVLSPKKGLLHPRFKAVEIDVGDDGERAEQPVVIDPENFYEGRVFGELQSRAAVHMEVILNYVCICTYISHTY